MVVLTVATLQKSLNSVRSFEKKIPILLLGKGRDLEKSSTLPILQQQFFLFFFVFVQKIPYYYFQALHIEESVGEWAICADIPYEKTYQDMVPQFTTLIEGGIQGLVYNGDVDAACNFIGDEYFVENLGYRASSQYKVWRI